MAYWSLVDSELRKGEYQQALPDIERARALRPEQPLTMLDQRAYALARLGREEEAHQILARFEQLRREGKRVDLPLANIYCGLRDYDHAVEALEHMRVTEGLYSDFLYNPGGDELRGQPAYQALLERAELTNNVTEEH